jgi:hypothetical protein
MYRPTCLTLILDTHDSLLHTHSFFYNSRSVVIRYLYIVGITVSPHEAHTKLLVDANAALTFPILGITIPIGCLEELSGPPV